MQLIALELENFRQYAHARVDFETGVTAIVGANGSGKTTLVEAILWALYGARVVREGADTLRFLWSQGGAKVRVLLEFELGRRRYRIRRTPTDAELASLNADGAWTPLARGTTPVNEQVLQLLGMNPLQFQTSFCARQKELEFMGYSTQKRREEISRMLGYERITEAIDRATVATRALDAEVNALRNAIGDPQALQQQLQTVEAELQRSEVALRQEAAELAQAIQQRDAAQQQFEAQNALREQHLSLMQQRGLLEKDREYATQRVEELRTRWNQLLQLHERYKAIESDAKRYREVNKALQAMEQLAQAEQQRQQLLAEQRVAQQRRAQLYQERTELYQKREALEALQPTLQRAETLTQQLQKIRQIAQQAAQRARIEEQIQAAQTQRNALQQKAVERDALQQAFQAADAEYQHAQRACADAETQLQQALQAWSQQRADAEADARALDAALRQQRERIQQLESLGEDSECPTCGQPLGDAYMQVLQRTREEAKQTNLQLRALRTRLEQLKQEPETIAPIRAQLAQLQQQRDAAQHQRAQHNAQLQQLDEQLQQIDALDQHIRNLERQLSCLPVYDPHEEQRVHRELESLQPQVQHAQSLQVELRRLGAVEREQRQTEQRISDLQTQIDALPTGYDADQHTALRTQAEQLQPLYEEALQLVTILKERDALKQQIEQARAELDAKTEQLQQTERQIEQLGYAEQAYLDASNAYQQAQQQVSAMQQAVAARRAEVESHARLRDHLRQQLEQTRQLQQQLQQRERDLLMHQTLRKALQEFRTELNTRLRPLLASIATEFLSILTNGRYTELDIDEEYRFTVIDEGLRKAVISGGEEDIVNLSLRLALARLITERAGQPLSLLILDEVFASLDSERRHNVMELLNNLRTWFNQILVISHFEEINEAADRCLRIQRNPLTRASEITEPALPDVSLLAEPE
ncbi:MAG: AAA family ATPase [Fimbriimonadales bacterium]